MSFTIQQRLPTPQEFNHLRQLAGWPTFPEEVITKAFSHVLFSVCIMAEDRSIAGMGRVLGDDAIYFHIQDVIIHPAFQRQGIGKILMDELMNYINARSVKNTMIGLMCSKGREPFYKNFGFIERPNEKFGAGMVQIN